MNLFKQIREAVKGQKVALLLLLLSVMVLLPTGCSNPDYDPGVGSKPETVQVIQTQEASGKNGKEESSEPKESELPSEEKNQTDAPKETELQTEGKTENKSELQTEEKTEEETEKQTEKKTEPQTEEQKTEAKIDKNGTYTSKDDVALYIHTYGTLPSNFITKAEAEALGWSGGGLDPYADGKSIGGDKFGNREGLLPKAKGRTYTECDIDTMHKKSRGAKRIVFSNDGLIYYTDDHYESFTLLYGEE